MNKPANFEPRSEVPLIKARSLVFLRHRRRDLDEALRSATKRLHTGSRCARAKNMRSPMPSRSVEGQTPPAFGEHMTEICLHALRADPRRIAAVLAHELPPLAERTADDRE